MLTLGELVAEQGPLRVRDAIGWTLRCALTVWVLHAEGVVHGRIHPGAVRVAGADCSSEGVLLHPAGLDDDPGYHSLERAETGEPSMRDDVWALGVLLHVLLTGKLPYPKGVVASVEGERLRPPTPLAVHQAELDVMQPVVDRLIRIDFAGVAFTIEEVVLGLRDFSPAIADLPPLAIEPPPRSRPAALRWLVAGVVLAVVIAFAIAFRVRRERLAPAPVATPAPMPVTTPSPATEPPATASPTKPPGTIPSPDSPVPSPTAVPSADPHAQMTGDGDMVACVAPLFPGEAFPEKITADFPCRERDPKALVSAISEALAKGSGGAATDAMRAWHALGWYRLATAAVARARCCDAPPPLSASPLLATCKLNPALAEVTGAAFRSEAELAAALDTYRAAIRCVGLAGGGPLVDPGLDGQPTLAQSALFVRVLTRLRAPPGD